MCGLVFARRKDGLPVAKTILKRYKNQATRGKQGFGYITIDNNKITGYKRFMGENSMEKELRKEKASTILFHHRYPTSTPNLSELNHPILVDNEQLDYKYYVCHNGVLWNEKELKTKHEGLGFKYNTFYVKKKITKEIVCTINGEETEESEEVTEKFNDSESLAIELARYLDGKIDSLAHVRGSIAFICIKADRDDNVIGIFYGRNNGNPLIIERDKSLFILKSEGAGYKIDTDEITMIDYIDNKIETIDEKVGYHYTYQNKQEPEKPDLKQKSWGFETKNYKVEEELENYYKKSKSSSSNSELLNELLSEKEDQIDELTDREQTLVNDLKDLRQQLSRINRTYHTTTYENLLYEIESIEYDLTVVRKNLQKVEDEYDQLTAMEVEDVVYLPA